MFLRAERLFICLLLITVSTVLHAETWPSSGFNVEMGKLISRDQGITVEANQQGQILLSTADSALHLTAGQRASFTFLGTPPPRIYLIWRTENSDQLYQHGFATNGNTQSAVDLVGVTGWEGRSQSMEVGFLVDPGSRVTLIKASISVPGAKEKLIDVLDNWSTFRAWKPVDINIYTGTRSANQGPYPAQMFALCALILVFGYLVLRRRRARWTGVAMIIFTTWVALDAFWQWRLWQQLEVTRALYAGLASNEKPLFSEDAAIANLARRARRAIDNPDPKIFIASQSDSGGMRAAYYMSPLNTYWHRRGAELPDDQHLLPGDYMLVVPPSAILYNRGERLIRLPPGGDINVIERYTNDTGLLLEVAE